MKVVSRGLEKTQKGMSPLHLFDYKCIMNGLVLPGRLVATYTVQNCPKIVSCGPQEGVKSAQRPLIGGFFIILFYANDCIRASQAL
jgi:hypothetical protein